MLAARSGNVALVEQLLDRGADEDLVDDYGHTAWMGALNRAIDDHAFGKAHLGALFERLGPDTLDVHADGRLVAQFSQIDGYRCLSLMRASGVVKCQLALA